MSLRTSIWLSSLLVSEEWRRVVETRCCESWVFVWHTESKTLLAPLHFEALTWCQVFMLTVMSLRL